MVAAAPSQLDAKAIVSQYCDDVINGTIPACKWVSLAVRRHVKDMKTGKKRGLWFDWAEAQKVVDFFGLLKHSKGKWAGTQIELEPWQVFIECMIFGWKREDGTRRFRTAYEEVARKNGKSTRVAGEGIYAMLMDGEGGAEVYSAATKRDQAKIAHVEATRMVRQNPWLRKRISIFKDNLNVEATNSKYEPLGADANTLDGLNPHWCNVDEVHAHKNRELWDVLETATGSREQPMMRAITTAGHNRAESICLELRGYATQVLEGIVEDDSFFAIIYTLDEGDAWDDESVWIKANPNLGVSVSLDDLRRKCKKAKMSPSAQNNFRCKHLNEWTEQEVRFIDMALWDRCAGPIDLDALSGEDCFAAVDMSSTSDFTAVVLYFPDHENAVLPYFFLPEDAVDRADRRHQDAIRNWHGKGFIEFTDGNEVDTERITDVIKELGERFNIRAVAFDPWNATAVYQPLMKIGVECEKYPQTFPNMNEPTKKLRTLIEGGNIRVGDSPVLKWMASNTSIKEHESGAIRPIKPKGTNVLKIDGVVALIMAIGMTMRAEQKNESVYKSRGLTRL